MLRYRAAPEVSTKFPKVHTVSQDAAAERGSGVRFAAASRPNSRKDRVDDAATDVGQAEIAAGMAIGQTLVIDP